MDKQEFSAVRQRPTGLIIKEGSGGMSLLFLCDLLDFIK